MAEQKGRGAAGRGRRPTVTGTLHFVDLGELERPRLRMDVVDPYGKRREVPLSVDGGFSLDPELVGKGYALELVSLTGQASRRYRYDDFVRTVEAEGVYRLPASVWGKLLLLETCVTGTVSVCRPSWPLPWDIVLQPMSIATRAVSLRLSPTFEPALELFPRPPWFRCQPVCQGKVEVFVRTCCCPVIDPPVIIDDICKIIDCDLIEWPPKPWPDGPWPPGPWPDGPWPPGPPPPLPPGPLVSGPENRAFKRSTAVEGAPSPEQVFRLRQHIANLRSLPRNEQIAYIDAYPQLRYWGCKCTTTKVAEAPLQEDGSFEACYLGPFFLRAGCTRRVMYRVSQIQDSGWVVIYDGLAQNKSFAIDEEAALQAGWNAVGCDDPHEWGPTPFALLESIGSTWADALIHSTNQNGETSFAGPLAPADGLVNPAPPGPVAVTAGPYDQPWGATLALHCQFHPGLEALGAKYFRTRVVPVSAGGNPTGPGFTVTGSLSWRKYYDAGGGSVGTQWVELSNPLIGGVAGLYTIPYPDLLFPWLGGQYHAYIDTAALVDGLPKMPNGRYLFVLDLFDAAGTRLVPTNSGPAGPGEASTAYEYRRLDGPVDAAFSNTSVLPYKALACLFRVDNLTAYADIEQILHDGVPSAMNCQFLSGPGSDTVQLRYSAYQNNGYLWYHRISIKQGLTGPTTGLPASNSNVYSGDTAPLTFSALLGAETKCAFSANMVVRVRHTNGSGRLEGYDRYDVAAFALEIGS